MIIVSDTTPLITLMKASMLEILFDLYKEIQIPKAVYDELSASNEFKNEAAVIRKSSLY